MNSIRACLVASLLVTVTQPSMAQPQAPAPDLPVCSESESSEWLYLEANKALDKGYFRGALEFSQAAFAESHCARHLVQLALAEQGLRRWLDATTHMRTALSMNDEWIQKYKAPLLEDQRKMEEQLAQAGGRNEDQAAVPVAAPRVSTRISAGRGLLLGGLIVAAGAIATMSVAEAFNQTVDRDMRNLWTNGVSLYYRTLYTGGALLALGGVSVATGALLFWLSPKEKSRQGQWSISLPNRNSDLSIGWAF